MYLRYSSRVVAPMSCRAPRAMAGFSKFAASEPPSIPPAPTRVWISSITSTMLGSSSTSRRMLPSRSSNSPRYLVPATSIPMSSSMICLLLRVAGTSPLTMRRAMPSAMAVLPTPGSPTRTALFFRRRPRICVTRSTSLYLPIKGSSCPAFASSVMFVLKSLRDKCDWSSPALRPLPMSCRLLGFFLEFLASSIRRDSSIASALSILILTRMMRSSLMGSTPRAIMIRVAVLLGSLRIDRSRCSVPM
mmetsp:Transcript_125322/g.217258  ORF Transcript_125322/g.217258 Transcript_125322/m.217258 type:complete len:247 (+) Transcript_125322:1784-2524(+)